jgi:hypothetical protein
MKTPGVKVFCLEKKQVELVLANGPHGLRGKSSFLPPLLMA